MDILFFGFLLLLASGACFYLFYHQTLGNTQYFHSDMKAYILEMQGLDSGYEFPYPILFRLGAFFHLFAEPELSMALATTVLNSLGMVCCKWMLDRAVLVPLRESFGAREKLKRFSFLAGWLISVVSVALFFVSMLYLPGNILLPGIYGKYRGVFSPNPFHNATYMAARPFALLAFFSFAFLLEKYEKGYDRTGKVGPDLKAYLFFAVSLLLATMAKPSFTIVLVGSAGLIMVWRFFRNLYTKQYPGKLLPMLELGLSFLPTFGVLLYQYSGVFVPDKGAEGGMGFCLGEVWKLHCGSIPLGMLLAGAFPFFVLLCNLGELRRNTLYRFSWQIYGMGFAMAYLLYEKGFRKPDFNFSWGYMYGIFFAFVGSVTLLLGKTGGYLRGEENLYPGGKIGSLCLICLQWLAFLAHVVCGVYYFYGLTKGQMYY